MDRQKRTLRTSEAADAPSAITQDAVVVVPGIMGSALKDTTTGKRIWGLESAAWYVKAWTHPKGLQALHLTEDELEGKTGRVEATGLLTSGAWTPYLRGSEPYTDLLARIRKCVAHEDAVLPFAYDWRLPVATNAQLLAEAARRHLSAWQNHQSHDPARADRFDRLSARLVFVAHSMGGLVTRAALEGSYDSELADDTRGVITLGTPFHGAVKAAVILNTGRGAPIPLPRRRLRALCATMPGLHDLLPQYRSVRDGDDVRHLTPSDVAAIGGNAELARNAADFHKSQRHIALPDHRSVVGINQPTWQNLSIKDGKVEAHLGGARQNSDGSLIRDRRNRVRYFQVQGDGTVYKESAEITRAVTTLPLQHSAVAQETTALDAVEEILRKDAHLGPPQGEFGCGLTLPDMVEAGLPWTLTLNDVDSLAGLTCHIHNIEDDNDRHEATLGWMDGSIGAQTVISTPGLHRVEISTLDGFKITQIVMATDAGLRLDEAE
ncbi:esterase/lipase family protein [Streptomyces sp. NPDC002004]